MSDKLTPEGLKELRKVAEAAAKVAPGAWDRDDTPGEDGRGEYRAAEVVCWAPGKLGEARRLVDTHNTDVALIEEEFDQDGAIRWDAHGRVICQHIATFDPPKVLSLLDRIDTLERERDEARKDRDAHAAHVLRVAQEAEEGLGALEEADRCWEVYGTPNNRGHLRLSEQIASTLREVEASDARALAAEARAEKAESLWTWLASREDLTLDFGYPDVEEPGEWQVHRVSGNRNDREWDLIASGATPLEALRRAAEALAPQAQGEGASPAKKTMTITLTDEEVAALDELARKQELDPPRILRQALRTYQLADRGLLVPAPPSQGSEA